MPFRWDACAGLRGGGGFGVAVFWLRVLVGLIYLVFWAYSIFLITVTGSKIWLKVIGSSLLVSSIMILVSSIVVFVFLFIVSFDLDFCRSLPDCGFQLLVVFSLFSHVASCVYIVHSTEASAESYVARLLDFCAANPADNLVREFRNKHPTNFSVRSFVYQRTIDPLEAIVAFFAIWVGGNCALVLCTACLDTSEGNQGRSPLLLARNPKKTGRAKEEEGSGEAGDPEQPASDQASAPGGSADGRPPPSTENPPDQPPPISGDGRASSDRDRGRTNRRHRRATCEGDAPPDSADTFGPEAEHSS
jgi:hypothetical protein